MLEIRQLERYNFACKVLCTNLKSRCEPVFIKSKSRLHQKIERIISRRPSSEEKTSDKEEKPTRLKILDIWIGSVKTKDRFYISTHLVLTFDPI